MFFRHVGIDLTTPTPIEAAILGRLFDGGFPARTAWPTAASRR